MTEIKYREAIALDIPAMAQLRTGGWGYVEFWTPRVTAYLNGTSHPQHALATRMLFIANTVTHAAGFIAGHLTTRYGCDGELQWLDVAPDYRERGVASSLLRLLAGWFTEQKALKVCVNVDPANIAAHAFYKKHGAEALGEHWMVWNDISAVLKI